MSYILDALKKAEAQRALGALPNIHAPAVFAATPDARASLWRRALRWGALTALVTILVALAWFRPWQRGAVPPTAAPGAPPRSAAPALSITPSIAPALPPSARAEPTPAAPAPTPRLTPKSVPPQASKQTSTASRLSQSLSLPQQQPAAAVAPAKKPAPAPTLPDDTGEPALLTLRELPAQIQTQIPALVISGYIYSSSRAERSLLINNQLLREGDTVVPGLILEQMLPGAVVLNYQGYRYRMPY